MLRIDPKSERSLILTGRRLAARLSRVRPLALLVAAGTVLIPRDQISSLT